MKAMYWLSPGDPRQRTGGFLYNARMIDALCGLGADVQVLVLDSHWPVGGDSHAVALNAIPDASIVIADGLLWPGLVDQERRELCQRTTVWVVVHSLMDKEGTAPLAALETMALLDAHGCFATSARTAAVVAERLQADAIPSVIPGTESVVVGSGSGAHRLLAVGNVVPNKGYRRLLEDLSKRMDDPWTLDIVGSLEHDVGHATEIQAVSVALGLAGRVCFHGELGQADLDRAYVNADLMVHAADFESYGMVLTEALKRGLPVVSTPAGALDGVESDAVKVVGTDDVAQTAIDWVADAEALRRGRHAARSMVFPSWADQALVLASLLGLKGLSADSSA